MYLVSETAASFRTAGCQIGYQRVVYETEQKANEVFI